MRHHVRESAESPEWPTFASSTTTSSLRTRGAESCASRNSFSPYCSELIPRRKTRPSFAMFLPPRWLIVVPLCHGRTALHPRQRGTRLRRDRRPDQGGDQGRGA